MSSTSLLRSLAFGLLATAGGGTLLGLGCSVVETETLSSSSASSASSGGGAVSVVTSSSVTTGGGMAGAGGSGGAGGTGGSGGSGGSGGAPLVCTPDTGGDACPGDTIPLALGTVACFEGSLADAKNDYGAKYCKTAADSSGPERVYRLTFAESGLLKVTYRAVDQDFDPTLHLRQATGALTDCANGNQELSCLYFLPTVEGVALDIDAVKTPDAYLFLDTASAMGGKYRMEISYTQPTCGDGVVSKTLMEECDDGNTQNADGCDKNCKLETITVFDACPGESFPIALNQTLTFSSNTAPYKDGNGVNSYHPLQAANCSATSAKSKGLDRVYQLKAKSDGTVTATVGLDAAGTTPVCELSPFDPGCWDRVLYAVEAVDPENCGANCTCDTGMQIPNDPVMGQQLGQQLACSQKGILAVEDISFPVVKGRTYFIVVDGNTFASRQSGPFNLRVSLK